MNKGLSKIMRHHIKILIEEIFHDVMKPSILDVLKYKEGFEEFRGISDQLMAEYLFNTPKGTND